MTLLEELPARVDNLALQISHLREEMRGEFSAVRQEMREGNEAVTRVLRAEMKAMGDELYAHMRVLHEEVIARLALIGEGRPHADGQSHATRSPRRGKGPRTKG